MKNIQNPDEFLRVYKNSEALLAYFSTTECNVCKVLKPKVIALVEEQFPKMETLFVETNKLPQIAAQFRVFTVPTIIVFFDGKEFIRKSRSFSLSELESEVSRFYNRLFS